MKTLSISGQNRQKSQYTQSFGNLKVLKRAEKAFNAFQQTNHVGGQKTKIAFNNYFESIKKAQNNNPIHILIDYLKINKNEQKKLVIRLTKGKSQILPPLKLASGFDTTSSSTQVVENELFYTNGMPEYLKQLRSIGEATNTLNKATSRLWAEKGQNYPLKPSQN